VSPSTPFAGPGDSGNGPVSTNAPSSGNGPSTQIPSGSCGSPVTSGPVVVPPSTGTGSGGLVATTEWQADDTDWRAWWQRNRRSLLDIERHVLNVEGRVATGASSERSATERVRLEVVPALIETLRESRDPALTQSTLFALARLGEECDPLSRSRILAALQPSLAIRNRPVLEAAVLALGAFGSEEQAQTLARILEGEKVADLMRDVNVDERVRSIAALGLALLGHRSEREDVRRFVVHHLVRGLQRVDFAGNDVDAACALGLGIVPVAPDSDSRDGDRIAAGSRQAQVRALLVALQSKDAHRSVRAHAATSLGSLLCDLPAGEKDRSALRAEAIETLREFASRKRRADAEVVQSAVLALGHVGDADAEALDRDVRDCLVAAGDLADGQARGFSMIALAEAAARPGVGADMHAGMDDAALHLAREVERDRSGGGGWASLALGVLGRMLRQSSQAIPAEAQRALVHALEKGSSTDVRSAACLGLGLAGDRSAAPALREAFRTARGAELRGWAALGLGLVDARETVPELRRELAAARSQPALFEQISTALVLLEDPELVPTLLQWAEDEPSREARESLHAAIGLAGDRRALGALLAAAQDRSRSSQDRALSIRSLGEVADSDPLPWSTALLEGVNYRAHTNAMADACRLAMRATD
jgi:HEAT repeat protein